MLMVIVIFYKIVSLHHRINGIPYTYSRDIGRKPKILFIYILRKANLCKTILFGSRRICDKTKKRTTSLKKQKLFLNMCRKRSSSFWIHKCFYMSWLFSVLWLCFSFFLFYLLYTGKFHVSFKSFLWYDLYSVHINFKDMLIWSNVYF